MGKVQIIMSSQPPYDPYNPDSVLPTRSTQQSEYAAPGDPYARTEPGIPDVQTEPGNPYAPSSANLYAPPPPPVNLYPPTELVNPYISPLVNPYTPPVNPYTQQQPYAPVLLKEPGRNHALVGLILGSIGLLTCSFIFFSLPISIVGIVFSALGRRSISRKGMAIAGLLLSILALVLTFAGCALSLRTGTIN